MRSIENFKNIEVLEENINVFSNVRENILRHE